MDPAEGDERLSPDGVERQLADVDAVVDVGRVVDARGAVGERDRDERRPRATIRRQDRRAREAVDRRHDRRPRERVERERQPVEVVVDEVEVTGAVERVRDV
jgi:hypothetical protein